MEKLILEEGPMIEIVNRVIVRFALKYRMDLRKAIMEMESKVIYNYDFMRKLLNSFEKEAKFNGAYDLSVIMRQKAPQMALKEESAKTFLLLLESKIIHCKC